MYVQTSDVCTNLHNNKTVPGHLPQQACGHLASMLHMLNYHLCFGGSSVLHLQSEIFINQKQIQLKKKKTFTQKQLIPQSACKFTVLYFNALKGQKVQSIHNYSLCKNTTSVHFSQDGAKILHFYYETQFLSKAPVPVPHFIYFRIKLPDFYWGLF